MKFPNDSELASAIPARHSVRKYLSSPIPEEIRTIIEFEIQAINERCGFSFRLVCDEPNSFRNIFAYGKFKNAQNYIIISAPKGARNSRLCGFEGERLVLALQSLGLNSCWVGLSYSKNSDVFNIPQGHKIRCVISFGYGSSQGSERSSKSIEQLSNYTADSPQWFANAIRNVMLAPTAINQQKFFFSLQEDNSVIAKPRFSLVGYTEIDLGIAILHFNLAAPDHTIHI